MTKRDIVEEFLIENFVSISPFDPSESKLIEKYKNNNFGLSSVAFSLYSNGHNLRGQSSKYKYGLLYEDGESIFSIGYFRKETDAVEEDGYIIFVAPTGDKSIKCIQDIVSRIKKSNLPVKGFYVRYLNFTKYLELLNNGALPIKESPWHPEAAEEDETFSNSLVRIDDVISVDAMKLEVKHIDGLSKNSRKKVRYAFSRFENFLNRKKTAYELVPLTPENHLKGLDIIKSHFEMLKAIGKNIGSSPEDHYNALDPAVLASDSCKGFLGYLNNVPVSIFIGENISKNTFALYTPFTIRNIEIMDKLVVNDSNNDLTGVTAMPTYAYVKLLGELKKIGYEYVDFGGSEIADLNRFKRQIGGVNKPTYWAYLPKTF